MTTHSAWEAARRQSSPLFGSPRRASDEAERYLRSLIFTRQLGPGDTLPPERELSEQLGIAPLTLRVALRALEADRFLTVRRGAKGGPQVNDAETLTTCWRTWISAHEDEIVEIFEYSIIIEENIAMLAAKKRTDKDLVALEAAMQWPDEQLSPTVTWHLNFHDTICRAAHNRWLMQASEQLRKELFIPVSFGQRDREDEEEFRSFHELMFPAVLAQDSTGAANVSRNHTSRMRDLVLRAIAEGGRRRAAVPSGQLDYSRAGSDGRR